MVFVFSFSPKMILQIRKMGTANPIEVFDYPKSKSIKVIETISLDDIDDDIYAEKMENILKNFPVYKLDKSYREVKKEIDLMHPADKYFYIEFTGHHEPMMGLYSFLNFYLLAIAAVGKIFVLQHDDFGVPKELLEGKELVFVNCGVGYSTLPMNVRYSHYDLSDAVKVLSGGYKEGKRPVFMYSISRIIGMTSESARFLDQCNMMKRVLRLDRSEFLYPSERQLLMYKKWSKMSKFARTADDNSEFVLNEENKITKVGMRSVLSLLNGKYGTKAEKKKKLAAPGGPGEKWQRRGISTLAYTRELCATGCVVRRQHGGNRPIFHFEERCGNQTRVLGCGMKRQQGGKHPVFYFEEGCTTAYNKCLRSAPRLLMFLRRF